MSEDRIATLELEVKYLREALEAEHKLLVPPPIHGKQYKSYKEAAEQSGINEKTLRAAVRNNVLDTVGEGRTGRPGKAVEVLGWKFNTIRALHEFIGPTGPAATTLQRWVSSGNRTKLEHALMVRLCLNTESTKETPEHSGLDGETDVRRKSGSGHAVVSDGGAPEP